MYIPSIIVDWVGLQDTVGSAKGGHLHAGKAMYQAVEQPGSSAVLIQLQHACVHTDRKGAGILHVLLSRSFSSSEPPMGRYGLYSAWLFLASHSPAEQFSLETPSFILRCFSLVPDISQYSQVGNKHQQRLLHRFANVLPCSTPERGKGSSGFWVLVAFHFTCM